MVIVDAEVYRRLPFKATIEFVVLYQEKSSALEYKGILGANPNLHLII